MTPNWASFQESSVPSEAHVAPPPPQIFGGSDSTGCQVSLPAVDMAQMLDVDARPDEKGESKRRRIARACDMCRKKKIKCDGRMPACSHCLNYKTDCVFTHVEKKRSPPKGTKYIEGLENRLKRMENILRLSGLLEDDAGAIDLGALEQRLMQQKQASGGMTPQSNIPPLTSPLHKGDSPLSRRTSEDLPLRSDDPSLSSEDTSDHELEALSELMCSLVTTQNGETRYIGSSSGFSIFSPMGIRWVNEKTGNDSFQRMISNVSVEDHKWTNWKPEVFGDLFQRPISRPLPPKQEALSLLQDYFENFNCMFPLFHQPTFMHLVERQYSGDPYHTSGWWASLNVVLAIAHRLRVMSNLVPQDVEDRKAWGYFKNAMGVFTELTMRSSDLLSVQALLGMALFMQGTPNPQPSALLVSAALRLSHNIGLHKKGTGFNLNPVEIEQRKRVFWIAYILDKEMCLRSGRPPLQDDDDMNVELPDTDPEDNIGNIPLADGKGKLNIFRCMCELTRIEGKVYKQLYSCAAIKQTIGELLNTIGELDTELEEWKNRIPIDFRPEHEIRASHSPLIVQVVMLHFSYYNCLTTIHRMSVHRGYWTDRISNYAIQGLNSKPLNPRVFASSILCTSAARASIALLKYMPKGDFSCVWLIMYFPVSALVTLFGNILQNPLDPKAKSDTKLMKEVVSFLSMLGQEAESGGVHRMLGVCSEFAHIAEVVIDKAEKGPAARRKRKGRDAPSGPTPTQPDFPSPATSTISATPTAQANQGLSPKNISTSITLSPDPSPIQQDKSSLGSGGLWPASASGQSLPQPSNLVFLDPGTSWPCNVDLEDDAVPAATSLNDSLDPMNVVTLDTFQFIEDWDPTDLGAEDVSVSRQPLLPQDLYSLPMTLDWNWAEMSGGAYPSVENGRFGEETPM